MTLKQFAADHRLAIFESLKRGANPAQGEFDADVLKEARTKGAPQLGATRYFPDHFVFEFIYPDPKRTATVLTVAVPSPERIVFLPVPEWVVENIWQGDVEGSFHFESDARRLMEALNAELSAEGNRRWFEPQPPKRRE